MDRQDARFWHKLATGLGGAGDEKKEEKEACTKLNP
jgi:hypothetical protein